MEKNIILLTGRGGSKSIIKKNVYPVLGRPLVSYPMTAATEASLVDAVYVSTDCPDIKNVAKDFGIGVIDRPAEISQDNSEQVDAYQHGMEYIGGKFNYLITMHCNCAVHRKGMIDECITIMNENPEADSCVTGYIDKSVHPFRTKQVVAGGYLVPWMDMPENTSTNRQNLTPCFILDGAVRVLRVKNCFPPHGQPPFTYLGNKILHVENRSGGDIHNLHDIPYAESVLRDMGWVHPDEESV